MYKNNKSYTIKVDLPAKPLRLDIDPEFDVFRRLARKELPPALTQVFGAEKVLIILPSEEKPLIDSYITLATSLARSYSKGVNIKMDNEIQNLPTDKAVWILGWENRFLNKFSSTLEVYKSKISNTKVVVGNKQIVRKNHSLALTTRHPDNPKLGWAWAGIGNPKAFSGFARKLPHYHKYSYLAFEGDEPKNIVKAKWPVLNSPMTVFLSKEKNFKGVGKLVPRISLAHVTP